ncbi:MAG: hypothetical protein AABN33_19585 [Acidobacteriota bacterium]
MEKRGQACIYKAARQVKKKMHVAGTRFPSGELAWVAALRVTHLGLWHQIAF